MDDLCTAKQFVMSGTEIDLNSLDETMLLALLLEGSPIKVSAVSVRRALDQDAACVTDARYISGSAGHGNRPVAYRKTCSTKDAGANSFKQSYGRSRLSGGKIGYGST